MLVPISNLVSVALPLIVKLLATVSATLDVTLAAELELVRNPKVVAVPVIACAAVPLKVTRRELCVNVPADLAKFPDTVMSPPDAVESVSVPPLIFTLLTVAPLEVEPKSTVPAFATRLPLTVHAPPAPVARVIERPVEFMVKSYTEIAPNPVAFEARLNT